MSHFPSFALTSCSLFQAWITIVIRNQTRSKEPAIFYLLIKLHRILVIYPIKHCSPIFSNPQSFKKNISNYFNPPIYTYIPIKRDAQA